MQADNYDLVVVGQGAAGLAAALAAAEASPQARIAVLEAATESHSGGGTRWSPSNMRLASVSELAPGFEADMMAATGGRGDPAYFGRLAAEAPAAAAWVQSHGVQFHSPGYYLSVGPPRIQPVGRGAAIVESLGRATKEAGVAFHYACRAERLLRAPDGAVAGVSAVLADGTTRAFPARAVVLASGGFQGNPSMLREHFGPGGELLRPISPGSARNDGSGIRMALEAGARRSGDWDGMHSEPVDARSQASAPVVFTYPYGIVVDCEGRRFFDEGGGLVHETWERFSRAIHFDAPGRTVWAIFDARVAAIEGFERAILTDLPPLTSETPEGLAAIAGIAPDGLARTLAGYNAACTGDAARFDATQADGLAAANVLVPPKSNWARALDKPPYFAYPLAGAIVYTFGGVATNEHAEVLGDGGPIPGLYAAGEMTGHFHFSAPNAIAVLRALVFGRIAGRNAAARAMQFRQKSNQPMTEQ